MRYVMVMAGGSGTRLWPMSREALPKQLIPLKGQKSLLEIAFDRFDGLIPEEFRFVCAGEKHRELILSSIDGLTEERFLGEPVGRDTLNAVGLAAAVLTAKDPEAIIGTFTADHIIEPIETFQAIIEEGFQLAENHPDTLVTFGVTPNAPATGYGYLELGDAFQGGSRLVKKFQEKPSKELADLYFRKGPNSYLWNSGMFAWRGQTLLDCIRKYEPSVAVGLEKIADSWMQDSRDAVLKEIFPSLKKISVDYGVMEPASRDPQLRVVAVPMPLHWVDVGSWPSFADIQHRDPHGNAIAAKNCLSKDTENCLIVSSDSDHLVATIGCQDLIVIHTRDATLICTVDKAEEIKQVQNEVEKKFGKKYV